MLFILEALPEETTSGCSEELFYVEDLSSLFGETPEDPKGRQETWKGALESKGMRVNLKKTKNMISSENAGKVTLEGKFPCTI